MANFEPLGNRFDGKYAESGQSSGLAAERANMDLNVGMCALIYIFKFSGILITKQYFYCIQKVLSSLFLSVYSKERIRATSFIIYISTFLSF